MLSLVADNIVHEPASGPARIGKVSFAQFLHHLQDCFFESADNLRIAPADNDAATAEFVLRRLDLATYADRLMGMPVWITFSARYRFETRGALITRIVMDHQLIDTVQPRRAARRRGWRWFAELWRVRERGIRPAHHPVDASPQIIE